MYFHKRQFKTDLWEKPRGDKPLLSKNLEFCVQAGKSGRGVVARAQAGPVSARGARG